MTPQSSYLQIERDIDRVRYLDRFESILEQSGVSTKDVVLYGSSIMALCGIRSNGDLEFIPHPEKRSKFVKLARELPEANINEKGQMFFPGEVHSSSPDRFAMFGWDDKRIFGDERCYIEHGGYKFLKLELIVSQKAADRRPKDLDDLEMLEQERYIGGPDWNWDLVRRLPPWERPSKPTLWEQGKESLRSDGIVTTSVRVARHLGEEVLPKYTNPIQSRWEQYSQQRKIKPEVANELTNHYPAADLLVRQLSTVGFTRDDLVAAILSLEGYSEFERFLTEFSSDEDKVKITPGGQINGGIRAFATRWVNETNDNLQYNNNMTFPVEISLNKPLPARTGEWVSERFSRQAEELLIERRRELLKNSGALFYAILWPAVIDHFDDIEKWLGNRTEVVEVQQFELNDEFESFISSVYSVDERPMQWETEKKINELKSHGSTVRILTLQISEPDFRSWDGPRLSDRTHSLKMECRRTFQEIVSDYEYDVIIHTTDNYVQNRHLNKLLSGLHIGK